MCTALDQAPPRTADELTDHVHQLGAPDLLPRWSTEDLEALAADGKIPQHPRWSTRVAAGEVGLDTLLATAGLLAFTRDQNALDERVRRELG
jgi:transaldolase